MSLDEYLAACASRYSEDKQMLGKVWHGPGYHTRVPNGTWAHPTRDSLDYALGLLRAGGAADAARAAAIIRQVLALQETDPTAATYGIWPWLQEESLAEMAPPDWNWADFCGIRLVQMLIEHADLLDADLTLAMRTSVGHAAWSIFRRNVRPGYTNIAVMGAAVTAAVGELLGEARLLDYARRRLANVVDYTREQGGFNEYNSPTYTIVAIHECERILQLVQDADVRASADALRLLAWAVIAEHFHPATQQWAGPHSRVYADRLESGTVAYLRATTGADIASHPAPPERIVVADETHIRHLPCPEELRPRFLTLPAPELTVTQRFIKRDGSARDTWGTTWLSDEVALGTVNYDSMWVQRRGLLAYLKTEVDPAVVLRLRFLHDGKDFASAGVRNAQVRNRVLSAVTMLTNKGDYHLSLDRPDAPRFMASDFRARYELRGAGVTARQLADQRFELAAGRHRIVITTAPGLFGPHRIRWELGQSEDRIYLDAVCYQGEPQLFDLAELGQVVVTAGLEILDEEAEPCQDFLMEETLPDNQLRIFWPVDERLQVVIPRQAEGYWD